MASGFIILSDGRCLAPRYTGYDYLLELAVSEMADSGEERAFKAWLQTRVPAEGDIESGFGGFIKPITHENVIRHLDLRELTPANQERLWIAWQKAVSKLILSRDERDSFIVFRLKRLLRMRRLVRIKDNPDNLSDWIKGYVEPPTGAKAGPGW
jgi:hypothetical protein